MVKVPKLSHRKIEEGFFTTAGAKQPVNKARAGQYKVNTWQGKMVPFLRLKNTSMANQYSLK